MASKRFSKSVYLLPNLFTTLNLLSGYYAIVTIIRSVSTDDVGFSKAGAAILIAGLFDNLDGRIARLMKTTSRFGIEYDSLADLTSFCLAPALLVYTWGLSSFGRIGWLAGFLFFACGALRLARFNSRKKVSDKFFFHGLPTPVAAGLITTIVLLHPNIDSSARPDAVYLIIIVYAVALLMVSNVRFRTFKQIDFAKARPFHLTIILVLCLVIIVAKPVMTLFFLFAAYTAVGIFESFLPIRTRLRVEKELKHSVFDPRPTDDNEIEPHTS